MSRAPPQEIYVAYRRPDAKKVKALITALAEELGPPRNGFNRRFFVDTQSIRCGDQWYYRINAAHRAATCVLGVVSQHTVPRTEAEHHMHAIYLDELYLAQRSGRLLLVRIDESGEDLPLLGIGMSQSNVWTGTQTGAIRAIAAAIRSRTETPDELDEPPLRRRWQVLCVDAGHTDQLVAAGCADIPIILRPVPDPHHDRILRITKRPVRDVVTLEDLVEIVTATRATGLEFRLPYIYEVQALLAAPAEAETGWKHPLDLAVDPDGPPIWAIDTQNRPVAVTSRGQVIAPPSKADAWLLVEDRA